MVFSDELYRVNFSFLLPDPAPQLVVFDSVQRCACRGFNCGGGAGAISSFVRVIQGHTDSCFDAPDAARKDRLE